MNTYRIRYTRHDPVYGKGWVVLYYRPISATRTIKASSEDVAIGNLTKAVTKDRPDSRLEITTVIVAHNV